VKKKEKGRKNAGLKENQGRDTKEPTKRKDTGPGRKHKEMTCLNTIRTEQPKEEKKGEEKRDEEQVGKGRKTVSEHATGTRGRPTVSHELGGARDKRSIT